MNTPTKLILISLGLLVMSTSVSARDSHRNSSLALGYSGGHYGQHSSVYLGYSKNRNHHYKKHYSYKRYSTRSYGNNYNYNRHSYNNNVRTSCHPVSKTIVDHYGQYQNVGGTMCYDSYGQGYIVNGSRFFKH